MVGLRDRALIGVMLFSFARVGAVVRMKFEDYYLQGRRSWLRLQEKGGKHLQVPCHHLAEEYLDAYLRAAGTVEDRRGAAVSKLVEEDANAADRALNEKSALKGEMWQCPFKEEKRTTGRKTRLEE